jgi:hypothetical protein
MTPFIPRPFNDDPLSAAYEKGFKHGYKVARSRFERTMYPTGIAILGLCLGAGFAGLSAVIWMTL